MNAMLKKSLALLLSTSFLLGTVACGGGGADSGKDAPADDKTPASAAPSDVPEAEGGEKVLYMAVSGADGGEVTEYPWKNIGYVGGLMYRTLFLADADLTTLSPDLAVEHTVSDDGLTYTFTIADGVRWSDGEALTAEDVTFSIKTLLKASVCNAIFTNMFLNIEGAEAWRDGTADDISGLTVDGNVVTMKLHTPYAGTLQTLAQFAILPEHRLKDADPLELHTNVDFLGDPTTSGMLKVGEINEGNYITYVRNDNYAGEATKIDKIITYITDDFVTQAQAGKLDLTYSSATSEINQYQETGFMEMHPIDILFYRYFTVNLEGVDGNQNEAVQDIRVREAFLHAIDRETLASSIYPGIGYTINSGVQNSSPLYNDFEYEYNPEKAKELLAEANYDMDRPITILYYKTDQETIDTLDAIAYYLGEVGVKVELYYSQNATTDLFQTRNYDFGYKGLSAFNIGEWYGEYSSDNANFSGILGGDTRFDDLIAQYNTSTSESQRDEILKNLQDLEQESLFKLPFFTNGNAIFVNSDHVELPDGMTFGSPWYRTNLQFAEWDIKG